MPNAGSIIKTMRKTGLSEKILMQFIISKEKEVCLETTIAVINKMEKLLTKEQCLAVMEQQGCQKTGVALPANIAFGKKYADETLDEKIRLHNESTDIPHKVPCKLNPDRTLSVYWSHGTQGCGCWRKIKKLPQQPSYISPFYCGCCAGHSRHHLQNAFGVKLRLKEVVSSRISSDGNKRCEMLFEIVD